MKHDKNNRNKEFYKFCQYAYFFLLPPILSKFLSNATSVEKKIFMEQFYRILVSRI